MGMNTANVFGVEIENPTRDDYVWAIERIKRRIARSGGERANSNLRHLMSDYQRVVLRLDIQAELRAAAAHRRRVAEEAGLR